MKFIFAFLQVSIVSICFMTNNAVGKDDLPRGLRVSLSVPDRVMQGEPVLLTVRVENISQERRSFVVPDIRRFGPKTILFYVTSTNAEVLEQIQYPDIYVGGMKNMPPRPLPVQQLENGATVEFPFALMYDFPVAAKRKQVFKNAGTYSIRVTVFEPKNEPKSLTEMPYDGDKALITSEPVSVKIVSPETARDKVALAKLQELPDEYLLYAPEAFKLDCHAEAIKKIAEYFHEFSDTRYGRYCALPLGIALKNGIPDIDKGKIKTVLESMVQEKDFSLHQEATVVLDGLK